MALSANDIKILNDMRAEVKRLAGKVDGIRGEGINNSRNSISSAPVQRKVTPKPPPPETIVVLKVASTTGCGNGRYNCVIQKRTTTAVTKAGNDLMSALYQDTTATCIGLGVFDLATTTPTVRAYPTSSYYYAKYLESSTDGDIYLLLSLAGGC